MKGFARKALRSQEARRPQWLGPNSEVLELVRKDGASWSIEAFSCFLQRHYSKKRIQSAASGEEA